MSGNNSDCTMLLQEFDPEKQSFKLGNTKVLYTTKLEMFHGLNTCLRSRQILHIFLASKPKSESLEGSCKKLYFRRLGRFSFECCKVIGLACTTLHDWLKKKLAPIFHPIRSKTKTNLYLFSHVFPRFSTATCN